MSAERPEYGSGFGVLRQFANRQRSAERCELCGTDVAQHHPHLLEIGNRKLLCACEACAVLFSGQGRSKYKRVPRRVRFLAGFHMTDAQWDSLMIPINMAFFFHSSLDDRMVSMYPSPAGATESLLTLEAWKTIAEENPELRDMESDVEALLVNRVGAARAAVLADYYLLPIDECYKLVGLIRSHWRGFSGGTEVWQEITHFFDGLKMMAGVATGESHA